MMENHPIFIDREGKSMQFALSPCDIKETIRKQIQEYGGSMVAPHKIHKGVIKLRKPGPCVSPEEVSVQYITDCITDKKLLDIKKYKFENIIVETKEEDDISLPDVKLESPLEESDSPNISQSRRKSKIRQPYTKEDDEAIIQCILKLKASKLTERSEGIMNPLFKRNVDDLLSSKLWRAAIGELIATFLLIFLGCGTALSEKPGNPKDAQLVRVSLSFASLVGLLVWVFGNVSGAHLNPAITLAQLFSRRVGAVRALVYVCAQMGGCTLGALCLKFIVSKERREQLGITSVQPDIENAQAIGLEICITFALAITVFAVTDKSREDVGHGMAPLAVSFAILTTLLMAIPLTGASLNPARSFGPNVALAQSSAWKQHWIYWIGPPVGAISAAFIYDFILAPNTCLKKISKYFTDPDYDVHTNYNEQGITFGDFRDPQSSQEQKIYTVS
ncbi:DgyrCDS628 [Dimorphilus gyrociliatus]|uniref:DgyrCDS628 n=1 Tax=Dimorphilus gyrociliatus TaxID=2664684 RepID=A0A7I8V9R1_9ANNE|nr:DgyrCDS628 [Dimorphilus gyrociliatus]